MILVRMYIAICRYFFLYALRKNNKEGLLPMKKYYENANENAAFVRCVDVMANLMQKYGTQVINARQKEIPFNKELKEMENYEDKKAA